MDMAGAVSECPRCRSPISGQSRFCDRCGAPISSAGATESWTIGTDERADLRVNAQTVSRRHCRLEQRSDGYYVQDLGSTNGTFVNGKRLVASEVVRVTRGDRIMLGQSAPMPWPTARETSAPPERKAAARESLTNIPVGDIVFGGVSGSRLSGSLENLFAVGVGPNVLRLPDIPYGWPRPRAAWAVLGVLLATTLILRFTLGWTGNPKLLPGYLVMASFAVPVAALVFFLEMNSPRNISLYRLLVIFFVGGALSLMFTSFLSRIGDVRMNTFLYTALEAGFEETGKAAVLIWLVREARYRWTINGLIFGAAVGAGFAAFESAGYAYEFFRKGGAAAMDWTIFMRAIYTPAGHIAYTALIGAALWHVKGNRPFEWSMLLHGEVVKAWFTVILLHGIWNYSFDFERATAFLPVGAKNLVLLIIVWMLVFRVMKQGYREIELAKRQA
jgi:RsiW-degrading membrane proteinase PrsW (M82 family)